MDLVDGLNLDQAALIRWIVAGLGIQEVRDLHGDAGYLLGNMIAKYSLASTKYRISQDALLVLQAEKQSLDAKPLARSSIYGKSSKFIFEHPVPTAVVRRELLKTNCSSEQVRHILDGSGEVCILLRTEDMQLSQRGFRNAMPPDWKFGDDPYARYTSAGIVIAEYRVNVRGAIKR
jgi:hypothetical protein